MPWRPREVLNWGPEAQRDSQVCNLNWCQSSNTDAAARSDAQLASYTISNLLYPHLHVVTLAEVPLR